MPLYLDESDQDAFIDGTTDCVALRRKEADHIEVWDTDGEQHFGNVPAHFTSDHINAAMRFYWAGERIGRELGAAAKLIEIQTALGIDRTDAGHG